MVLKNPLRRDPMLSTELLPKLEPDLVAALPQLEHYHFPGHLAADLLSNHHNSNSIDVNEGGLIREDNWIIEQFRKEPAFRA